MSKKNNGKWLQFSHIALIVLDVFLVLVLIITIFATAYVNKFLNLINYETTPESSSQDSIHLDSWPTDPDWTTIPTTVETVPPDFTGPVVDPTDVSVPDDTPSTIIRHKNLVNILLIGQDRRPGEPRQRSDTMILVTINTKDYTITLTSFMRDLYVAIPGYSPNKLNAPYAKKNGGMSLLCETLLMNFGVYVDGCVEVDFTGFEDIINMLGGVEITLTEKEAEYFRDKLAYTNMTAGTHILTGTQALHYSRIRKIDSDFQRTERQRKVLTQVIEKCMDKSLPELLSLMETILPMITTDLTSKQITNYALNLFPVLAKATIKTQRIPAYGDYTSQYINDVGSCLVPDLNECRQLLIDTLLPSD